MSSCWVFGSLFLHFKSSLNPKILPSFPVLSLEKLNTFPLHVLYTALLSPCPGSVLPSLLGFCTLPSGQIILFLPQSLPKLISSQEQRCKHHQPENGWSGSVISWGTLVFYGKAGIRRICQGGEGEPASTGFLQRKGLRSRDGAGAGGSRDG